MFRRFRSLLLIGIVSTAAGGCPGNSIPCSNNPNLSQFGVTTIVIPAQFACSTTFPNTVALALLGYKQASTGILLSVQINPPESGENQGGADTTDLGPTTTANGVIFNRFRVTLLGRFSYVAGVTMTNGNNLFVTISGATDDPALQTTLATILESVVLK